MHMHNQHKMGKLPPKQHNFLIPILKLNVSLPIVWYIYVSCFMSWMITMNNKLACCCFVFITIFFIVSNSPLLFHDLVECKSNSPTSSSELFFKNKPSFE